MQLVKSFLIMRVELYTRLQMAELGLVRKMYILLIVQSQEVTIQITTLMLIMCK